MAMTIGKVITALSKAPGDMPVQYAFCGLVPKGVRSWRGIYAEAAIGHCGRYENGALVTVKELLDNLKEAIMPGISFEGYKGGTYRYNANTPLHVDNNGDSTNTEIQRIEVGEYRVMIHTQYEE